jgi:hypothetical protein
VKSSADCQSGLQNAEKAGLPCSQARMIPFKRVLSAIFLPAVLWTGSMAHGL